MKRLFLPCAALALLAARVEARSPLLFPVTLGKFENRSAYTGPLDLSQAFGTVLAEQLQGTNLFVVVSEAEMRAPEKTGVAGGILPAQLLLKGEITGFVDGTPATTRAELAAVITLVDAATGQVRGEKNLVCRARYVGPSPGLNDADVNQKLGVFLKTNAGLVLTAAASDTMGFCVTQTETLPWTGSVIVVDGKHIYFNRGQREGVAAGQVYRVGRTEVIRDPATGEILDNRFTEKAQVRVDSVKEKAATCSLIIGGGIERGMTVLLKE